MKGEKGFYKHIDSNQTLIRKRIGISYRSSQKVIMKKGGANCNKSGRGSSGWKRRKVKRRKKRAKKERANLSLHWKYLKFLVEKGEKMLPLSGRKPARRPNSGMAKKNEEQREGSGREDAKKKKTFKKPTRNLLKKEGVSRS